MSFPGRSPTHFVGDSLRVTEAGRTAFGSAGL
jgi:hypothetical protein